MSVASERAASPSPLPCPVSAPSAPIAYSNKIEMNNEQTCRVVESILRVRYAETDSMGIVYHSNYLVWMEIGRTEYFRALGFSYRELERDYRLYTPVVEVRCRYLAPARYDDEIVVRTRVAQI